MVTDENNHDLAVPPGTRRFAYRLASGPIYTARYEQYPRYERYRLYGWNPSCPKANPSSRLISLSPPFSRRFGRRVQRNAFQISLAEVNVKRNTVWVRKRVAWLCSF
ncbi:hypothetical protein BHM03_00036827 [Ensete ventricosum]|nr:hypothetical protein BHM03_00036827 [Ensete ventricosum]